MSSIVGQTQTLKPHQRKRLEATYRRKVPGDAWASAELLRHLTQLSRELGRQVGVLIDRRGEVTKVMVGDATRLYLPDLGRARAGASRLRGVRLVRTELRPSGLSRDDIADLSKLRLDAVIVVHADPQGHPGEVHWAHLEFQHPAAARPAAQWTSPVPPRTPARPPVASETARRAATTGRAADLNRMPAAPMASVRAVEAEMGKRFSAGRSVARETAILVGVWPKGPKARTKAETSLEELAELARTAGVFIADTQLQLRNRIDPKTVLGRGKIEDLTLHALSVGADVIIFDRDLAPAQLRAITNATDLRVIDRTQLILDIFARRATSRDGKLQVELAQLKYALPRLVEKSTAMSRLTGGIGGQGPGETKLELHRRRARDRIHRLETQIAALSQQRQLRRKRRQSTDIPVVSIVGYTNAGKSTLLNAITNAEVLAEDKLFATLDPTTRRIRFPEEREVIITDTVGFIRDLPEDLVNAFKATLEELADASLLLHVIDGSDPNFDLKRQAVERILGDLGLSDLPTLTVINKMDQTPRHFLSVLRRVTDGVTISARDRTGLEDLLVRIDDALFHGRMPSSLAAQQAEWVEAKASLPLPGDSEAPPPSPGAETSRAATIKHLSSPA